MATIQSDIAGHLMGGPRFVELVERKLGKDSDRLYSIRDVASVFDLSENKVAGWILEGRLPAANLNKGMTCAVDPENPSKGTRPLRPLWRMTHTAIMEMARNMEAGT